MDATLTRLSPIFAFGLMTLCLSSANAQDYQRYKPKAFSTNPGSQRLPEPPKLPSGGSDTVIVDSLNAIIVLDDKSKVDPEDAFAEARGVSYNFDAQTSLVYGSEIKQILRRNLGQPITLRRLNEMSRDIIKAYRRCGQPVVDVQIPEQKITSGSVQIVVIESRIDRILVSGGEYSNSCALRDEITNSVVGNRIYESCLQEDLFWLNRSPFRRVELDLQSGSKDQTSDLLFNVHDVRPVRGYVGYEDTGVETLGRERLIGGLVLGDVFGQDGRLGYQYTTDADMSALHAHAASYQVDFGREWSLLAYGSWASSSPTLPAPLIQSGESWQAGLAMSQYAIRTATEEQSISLGIDFKSTDNSLEFGTTNVSTSTADLIQLNIGYDGLWRQRNGNFLSLSYDLNIGPGSGFTSNSSAANFSSIRAATDPSYFYWRSQASARAALGSKFEFRGNAVGQISNDRLLFSETLGLGGYDSVRGYDQRTLNGDSGWILNLEVGPNPWNRERFGQQTSTRIFTFADFGQASTKGSVVGEIGDEIISSVGIGMRYSVSNRCNLRLDYGHAFSSPPGVTSRDRIHLGFVMLLGPTP